MSIDNKVEELVEDIASEELTQEEELVENENLDEESLEEKKRKKRMRLKKPLQNFLFLKLKQVLFKPQ